MKKLFFIALAGMMMFAFTQCDNGSKAYREGKKIINSAISNINSANDCAELSKANDEYGKAWGEWMYEYIDGYQIKEGALTEEEEKELEGLMQEFDAAYQKQVAIHSCL